MGIEPTALAWEARVLPLYDVRSGCLYTGSLGRNEACRAVICAFARQAWVCGAVSYGDRVVRVGRCSVAGAAARRGLEEFQQGGLALQPCAFVFHIQKVPGVVDGDELAVA